MSEPQILRPVVYNDSGAPTFYDYDGRFQLEDAPSTVIDHSEGVVIEPAPAPAPVDVDQLLQLEQLAAQAGGVVLVAGDTKIVPAQPEPKTEAAPPPVGKA